MQINTNNLALITEANQKFTQDTRLLGENDAESTNLANLIVLAEKFIKEHDKAFKELAK